MTVSSPAPSPENTSSDPSPSAVNPSDRAPSTYRWKDRIVDAGALLKDSAVAFSDDHATTLSAALAYYTVFSIAPLLLISLAIGGIFFGGEASRGEVFGAIKGLIGSEGASAVEKMVEASALAGSGVIATIAGVATLLIGATTVFGQLQDSLNTIWKVERAPGRAVWTLVRQRLLSFTLILVIAFLLLVSLITTAVLAAAGKFASTHLPGGEAIWSMLNFGVSFAITTGLFAALYKILPDVRMQWRQVWAGAVVTAFFFTVGKLGIGVYLGQSGVASTYGAAGSAVILLVWTYYSSAILLFGAEITRLFWLRSEAELGVKEGAQWMSVSSPAGRTRAESEAFGKSHPELASAAPKSSANEKISDPIKPTIHVENLR